MLCVLLAQWRGAAGALLALGMFMFAWPGRAQPVAGGQGFKFADYYDPPNKPNEISAGGRPGAAPAGRAVSWSPNAKYRTFRETGEGEMNVEAPQCTL